MNDDSRHSHFRAITKLIIMVLVALHISSCRTSRTITEIVTRTDTVIVKRDSIIIHDRFDTVEVSLPSSVQVIEVPIEHDTASVLSDKYYTSTAAVLDGRLRHTLRSNPGATLTGTALVHDTVKVNVDSTRINNHSHHCETKEAPVNHLHWWQKMLMWVGVIAIVGAAFTLYNYIKRK